MNSRIEAGTLLDHGRLTRQSGSSSLAAIAGWHWHILKKELGGEWADEPDSIPHDYNIPTKLQAEEGMQNRRSAGGNEVSPEYPEGGGPVHLRRG